MLVAMSSRNLVSSYLVAEQILDGMRQVNNNVEILRPVLTADLLGKHDRESISTSFPRDHRATRFPGLDAA